MRANFVFLTPARITQRGTEFCLAQENTYTVDQGLNQQKYKRKNYIKVVTMIIDNKPFRSLTGQLKNTYKEKKNCYLMGKCWKLY